MRYNNYHKHDHVSNIYLPDSNSKAEDYIKRCVEYGHTNYFTTNHGSMGDIFEAHTLCKQYGLRCLAGLEGYIVPDPRLKDNSNYHIMIVPRTEKARKKLNAISSRANMEGFYYRPRIFPEDLLALDPEDVYLTTACVAGLLRDENGYKNLFLPLYKHFGDSMMLEVQNHIDDEQIAINRRAVKLADRLGLKLIAANDSHYIDPEQKNERAELLKGKGISFGNEDGFVLDFPTAEVMFDRFDRQGVLTENQIETAIANTLIFDECEEINLDYSIKMPTIYPDLTPKERLDLLKSEVNKRFAKICKEEGIRGEEFERYKEGIRYEMRIIEDTNEEIHTADYFLFNSKLVELATTKYGGVLTRGGRGSCGSFYINRIMGMSQLDRFKINLPIFPDRFASTARLLENHSLPDIDMNLEAQEPFQMAAKELLGDHNCFPMVAYGTMQLGEAFRNVCRSKGLQFDDYNEVGKNIEQHLEEEQWKPYIEEAEKYVGTIVSASVHPCAHLIMSEDIISELGVSKIGDAFCVLMTSGEADEYKYLKDDFLIVKIWKLIHETFEEVGIPIIPANQLLAEIKDDERIWDLFKNGITCTLNQVDSDNGTAQAMKFGIHSFEDGALIAACIRPSFDSWRDTFLSHAEYSTGSEKLDDVLKMTHGYILFQESLMQYFDWLGVTPAESIGLIKKISKKKIKPEDFAKLEERLRVNWRTKNGSEDGFDKTWSMIQSCMSYGFCSAHAAATSLDMCYGAYLKVHYPLEYYTVCFNNYADDEVRTNKLRNELKYFGINLSGIKFGHSRAKYSYDRSTNTIYKGMESIKFMSADAAEALYALKDGEYKTWFDLLVAISGTCVNSRQLEILIGLDFFSAYGEINELLAKTKLFAEIYGTKQLRFDKLRKLGIDPTIVEPYAGKRTEKMFKEYDSLTVLNGIADAVEYKKTTLVDKITNEVVYLGYTQIVAPKADPRLYVVLGTQGFSNNIVTMYQLQTGETTTIKFKKGIMSGVEKGKVIRVDDISSERKWKKDANGEWTRIDEHEDVVTRIAVANT